MISRYRISVLAFGLFGLTACGGQTRSSLTQTPSHPQNSDSDSPSGDNDWPSGDNDTTTDNDTPVTTDDPKFGTACSSYSDCPDGMICAGLEAGKTLCTTPCVGSGKGGNDDCPSGWACVNWETTTLDGMQVCLKSTQLGASYPGYPFTTPPGGSCSSSQNACQSSICDNSNSCVVMCMSDRDCGSGDVCYAYTDGTYYEHICGPSDTTLAATGDNCGDNTDCDSGICLGACSNGAPCGSSADCGGGACAGSCVDHCRSDADCSDSRTTCAMWPMIQAKGQNLGSGWVPVCGGRNYSGTKQLGASCSHDSDCASEACLGGICTTPCATADDCAGLMPGSSCAAINFATAQSQGQIVFSASYCQ
jgi:hypothetical protein